jgi:hypothetical protein
VLREAEVRDLDVAGGINQQVFRLQVLQWQVPDMSAAAETSTLNDPTSCKQAGKHGVW